MNVVSSVFRLESDRGYFAPILDVQYSEKDTGANWLITCGGTRVYLVRTGNNLNMDINDQSADSHFMANRITSALFISGFGLFRASAMGRFFFLDISEDKITVRTHFDLREPLKENEKGLDSSELTDWLIFICQNLLFRRALDDAYMALLNPIEADFYIYRGMEWLLRAGKIGWNDLASDIGYSISDMREFKKMANNDYGQRHGIESGKKVRAVAKGYGCLVADYIYGFTKVRARVDTDFKGIDPTRAAEIVQKALPLVPYP
ncbi:hypothetical protein LLH00_01530 [bacterium]|nr:hypothetical protein [bacterium]